jgi:hypothetical protein
MSWKKDKNRWKSWFFSKKSFFYSQKETQKGRTIKQIIENEILHKFRKEKFWVGLQQFSIS